jgi:hypothetical protein
VKKYERVSNKGRITKFRRYDVCMTEVLPPGEEFSRMDRRGPNPFLNRCSHRGTAAELSNILLDWV